MKSDYPNVKIIYKITPEQEETPIEALALSTRAVNTLKRLKKNTIGDILENWIDLNYGKPDSEKQGLGEVSIKEIHAIVFAWLCENGCVSKLAMHTSKEAI